MQNKQTPAENNSEGKNNKKNIEVFNFHRESHRFQRVGDDRFNEVRNVKQPRGGERGAIARRR